MGLICAPVSVPSTAAAVEAMRRAKAAGADLVELRLDAMAGFDLRELLEYRPLPVVVTCRRRDQGGLRDWEESERLGTLTRALELGAEHVDVELGSESALRRAGSGRVILSHHDFAGMPADLPGLARDMAGRGMDVVKIAVTPAHPLDCLPLYALCRAAPGPLIAIGMGEFGAATRLLALRFGAWLSYGAITPEEANAPGQLAVADMAAVYRARELGPATRLFGVIGDPIAHSLSPAIHNAAYRQMGLDAVYVSFRVPDRPAEFLRAYAALGFEGFSVTIPHKEAALAAADEVDDVAQAIGAANTIAVIREPEEERRRRDSGRFAKLSGWEPVAGWRPAGTDERPAAPASPKASTPEPGTRNPEPGTGGSQSGPLLLAHNTDAEAAVAQLAAAFGGPERLAGKTVLLLGAGGVARALAWGLSRSGVRLVIANRTAGRGQALAAEVGAEFLPLDALGGLAYDAAVNATPLGMKPNVDATPLPEHLVRPGAVVFDTVYNPLRTRLLREANRRGARAVDGIGMFVEQAAQQIRIWTGQRAWPRLMREAALARLGET